VTASSSSPAAHIDPEGIRQALGHVREGRVYDLDCGRWHGMPVWSGHPVFQVLTYRTPRGVHTQGDHDHWMGANDVNFGWHSDLVMGSVHSGTHIDALCHITCGPDNHFHGGVSSDTALGDFGPLEHDATRIPSIIARGVLIDVARHRGVDALPAHDPIGRDELEATLAEQNSEIRPGDVALVRTGYVSGWPDPDFVEAHEQAGIDIEAALYLAERGVVAVGADTEALEVLPSIVEGNPHPVHIALLIERGIHIIEMVNLEELARDGAHEFAFVCLPLKIAGATGSMVRPVAIV
jgi:kynurenine formamidase